MGVLGDRLASTIVKVESIKCLMQYREERCMLPDSHCHQAEKSLNEWTWQN